MSIIDQLTELERQSQQRGIPIVGSAKGAWLLQKVQELKPKKILELGTANGYSGIILGSAGASITTIEIDENIAEEAMRNFTECKINAEIILGDGVSIVQELAQKNKHCFDLIFIDFAKRQYLPVLENCIQLVRQGGLIIADNISFDGCQDYKDAVLSHPHLKTDIIDIKDGLSCSEKK
ncbi:MAG: O-methyltransferase [Nanoarchaeota archaeon]|nr:O-methyltransferase [Nanoarchaeota archaeon]